MNELDDRNLSNIQFIKTYDPQKGASVSSGRLVSSEKNSSLVGIPEELLNTVNESINYSIDLCHKKISDLSQEAENSEIGQSQVQTNDKIKDLLLLIDESKKIKIDLANLLSSPENHSQSPEKIAELKAIAEAHIEQFSHLLNNTFLNLTVFESRNDAPLNIALNAITKPDLKTAMKSALDNSAIETVENLLENGADINMTLDDGQTLLTYVLTIENQKMTNFLIDMGADLNLPDDHEDYPILIAIENKIPSLAISMLKNPTLNVNVQNRIGNTALILASRNGFDDLVNTLLDRNAEINRHNNKNETAVCEAAYNGHNNIVRSLINQKADLTIPNYRGVTPLIASSFEGHIKCVRSILSEGIGPDDAVSEGDNTALHSAAYVGHDDVVKVLLKAGADPLKINISGSTPLGLAASQGERTCYRMMFAKIDLPQLSDAQKSEVKFSLVKGGMEEYLEDFIELYPEVNMTSESGETLLMTAASHCQMACVRVLLKAGAKTSGVFDGLGHDPLIKASVARSKEIVKVLLMHGADPNYRDINGFTAFEYFILQPSNLLHVASIFSNETIQNSYQHFNLNFGEHSMADLIEKINLSRSTLLHNRLDAPIDELTQASAEKMYDQLRQENFDMDKLLADNAQAYSRLQTARMNGSLTMRTDQFSDTTDWLTADETSRLWAKNREPIDADKLCLLNSLTNPKNSIAVFRDCEINAGGLFLYSYVPRKEVDVEVDLFLVWLKDKLEACDSAKENPIIVAALAYQRLTSIHPFNDGNGRTCRLVMDYVLQRYGLPPSTPDDVDIAIFALFVADMTPSKAVMRIVSGLEISLNIFK